MENQKYTPSPKYISKIMINCAITKSDYCLMTEWVKIVGNKYNFKFNAAVYVQPFGRYKSFVRNLYQKLSENHTIYSNCSDLIDGTSHKDLVMSRGMLDKHFNNICFGTAKTQPHLFKELRKSKAEFVIINEFSFSVDFRALQKTFPEANFIVIRNLEVSKENRRKLIAFRPDVVLNIYGNPLVTYRFMN